MRNQILSKVLMVGLCSVMVNLGAGCAKRGGQAPGHDVYAPEIKAAFGLRPSLNVVKGAQDRYLIEIKKDGGLEKEFLVSASMMEQTVAPTSHGLKGRVVAFRRIDDKVFMLETGKGHVVTNSLGNPKLILTSFPIVDETKDVLVIDFNAGMDKVLIAGNWNGTDGDGKDYDKNKYAHGISIKNSFIESARLTKTALEIRQIAQLDLSRVMVFPSIEVRYFITPYRPNPNFVRSENSGFDRVAFFEIQTQLEEQSGRNMSYISRWDLSKPISYAVSANTPVAYRQAVMDGILYWNKVMGREVVRAEIAPDGVSAPDPDHNVVQWVEWDSAGFAYADALTDPRSGETLHAQAFITSVFAISSKQKAARLLRSLRNKAKSANAHAAQGVLNSNLLPSTGLCNYDLGSQMIAGLESVVGANVSDQALERLSQDYVRLVVAHEIGHTMGLRHNFAGNLASNVPLKDFNEMFNEYLVNGTVPDPKTHVFTSSVMDYLPLEVNGLAGAQMMKAQGGFLYDQMAISWGYHGIEPAIDPLKPDAAPLFCTDSHAEQFGDCLRFDMGSNPIELLAWQTSRLIEQMPINLVEEFISIIAPEDPRDRADRKRFSPNPKVVVERIVEQLKGEIRWLGKSIRAISFERRKDFVGALNEDEIKSERTEWAVAKIEEMGGVDVALLAMLPAHDRPQVSLAKDAMKVLEEHLERPDVLRGLGGDGREYSLSSDDVLHIKTVASKYLKQVEARLLDEVLDAIKSATFNSDKLSAKLAERLSVIAETIIMQQSVSVVGASGGVGGGSGEAVILPEYAYKKELRKNAVELLNLTLGQLRDWSASIKGKLARGLKIEVVRALGTPPAGAALNFETISAEALQKEFAKIKPDALTLEQRQWYGDQKDLLDAFGTVQVPAALASFDWQRWFGFRRK